MIEESTPEELEACPFCAGREDRTPPETLRLGDPWSVRVVPNLYPSFGQQEVVIHAPEHVESFAALDDDQVDLVAAAWQQRAATRNGYVHAILNEGRAAGGSLPHSHSQLLWLDEIPPAVAAEGDVCDLLAEEQGGERIVIERDGLVAVCPYASRVPYELVIAPVDHEQNGFESPLLAPALRILRDAIRALQAVEGRVPLNAWLHNGHHWHLELVPRLTALAGLELGAGIYLNVLPPEEAAKRLREALP